MRTDFQKAFPGRANGLQEAQRVFETVRSFENIERVFLEGARLIANTSHAYLCAVRQFYEWSGGKHPLQAMAAELEGFYDTLCKCVNLATTYHRIQGLKRIFSGVGGVVPIFDSPFQTIYNFVG